MAQTTVNGIEVEAPVFVAAMAAARSSEREMPRINGVPVTADVFVSVMRGAHSEALFEHSGHPDVGPLLTDYERLSYNQRWML